MDRRFRHVGSPFTFLTKLSMNIAATPAITFVPFDALQAETKREQTPLRAAITSAYRRDETAAVEWLLAQGAAIRRPRFRRGGRR